MVRDLEKVGVVRRMRSEGSRCHDAFHKAAGGNVRIAIGPFFLNNDVREPPLRCEYRSAS